MRKQRVNGMKRLGTLMAAGMLIANAPAGNITAMAEEATSVGTNPKDIVLVIDESCSMAASDAENECDEAVKAFIDKLEGDTRLAIVTFGTDYGADAAQLPANCNGLAKNEVKVAYAMQDIADEEAKDNAKQVIDEEREYAEGKSACTPIGYALAAANDILNLNDSADGDAAIVLMSDGRITGQDGIMAEGEFEGQEDTNGEIGHSLTVDEEVGEAREHSRAIYCVELNMDGMNDGSSFAGENGRTMMREVIPESEDNYYILHDASYAQNAYEMIYAALTGEDEAETVSADADTKDFVLVIDESASVVTEDGENMCDKAAQMLIDTLAIDNARLGIVTFGSVYGSDAAQLPANCNGVAKNYVKIAYQMQDIAGAEAKEIAKQAIAQEREYAEGKIALSPVGYALAAANDMLTENGSVDGNAVIILMSDGRVSGQDGTIEEGEFAGESDAYAEGWHYHSVDEEVAEAREHSRAIYCVELNMDHKNDKGSGSPAGNVGRTMMREDIPESDEYSFELDEEADQKLLSVVTGGETEE